MARPDMESTIFSNPLTVDPPAPPRDLGREDRAARDPVEEPRRAEADSEPADEAEAPRADDDGREADAGDTGRDRTTEDGQSQRAG